MGCLAEDGTKMTVSSVLNKIIYLANGTDTSWTFPFPGVATGDIEVFITTSGGTITQLATNLYSVTLNAPIAPNPTGIGGAVNYPLSGSPLATGNTLTILRTLPLTQPTSLSAQGTMYQTVIEGALDTVTMEIQQLNELLGRQITVAVSDPAPGDLPPVAQRANMLFGFDSAGDPAAVALTTGSVAVSAAMIPVVGAATLGAARTALGLGNIATLNVGTGLISDGTNVNVSSNAQVVSVNHSIAASENNNHHYATVSLTFTLPAASTCFNGWTTWLTALTDYVTVAINGADSFRGMGVGQSFVIAPGSTVRINTDGVNTWFVSLEQIEQAGTVTNLQINATVAGNNLTIAIKDRNGNDPSASSPVILVFKGYSSGIVVPTIRTITSALSIVVPNGGSLGTSAGVPSRIWITAFDNGGTVVLGVYNPTDSTGNIKAFDINTVSSGTAISAGSVLAQTHYTASGVTNKFFVILGSIDITESPAGQWASAPFVVSLYGSGSLLPGDVVQSIYATDAGTTTSTGATPTATTLTASISMTTSPNRIRVRVDGNSQNPANDFAIARIYRDAATVVGNHAVAGSVAGIQFTTNIFACDSPAKTTATVYRVYIFSNAGGNAQWNPGLYTTSIYVEEIYA